MEFHGDAMNKGKNFGYDAPYFDDEEREIIEALKRGEYRSASNLLERIKELKLAAANTLRKMRKFP